MKIRHVLPSLVAATLLTCQAAGAADKVVSIPVDSDFQSADMRWNNATAGGYDALVALKALDGQIALCGVGIVTNSQLNRAIRRALLGGVLKLNGKTVVKNFTYFAKARSVRALPKSKANCKLTGVNANKQVQIDFEYGDGTFVN